MKPMVKFVLVLMLGFVPCLQSFASPTAKTIILPERSQASYERSHYAPAVRVGDTVYLSGIPAGGPGTYKEQVRRMFQRVEQLLAQSGATMADIVELTTFHATARDSESFQREFVEFVAVHEEFIPSHYPAWSAIGNAVLLAKGAVVEMRVVAVIGAGKDARIERIPAKAER